MDIKTNLYPSFWKIIKHRFNDKNINKDLKCPMNASDYQAVQQAANIYKLVYETIFSRTRGRISDPKELSLDENDLLEIYTERLNNVIANPRVRRLFSSLTLDDEIQQLDFMLNNSVDETADMNFVVGILVLGMTIEWLQPQVDSIMHTSVMIGGKEEKKLLDNHKNMIDRLDSMKIELNKRIRDYGYMYNSYINTES